MKRQRGRGRKPGNNPNRSYESNGPDVKVRGAAAHIADKYQQLARDAMSSGDRVMAENYYQHAEHYLRIVAANQSRREEGEDGGRGRQRGEQNDRQNTGHNNGRNSSRDNDRNADPSRDEDHSETADANADRSAYSGAQDEDEGGRGRRRRGRRRTDERNDARSDQNESATEGDGDDRRPRAVGGDPLAMVTPEGADDQAQPDQGFAETKTEEKPRRRRTRKVPSEDAEAEAALREASSDKGDDEGAAA